MSNAIVQCRRGTAAEWTSNNYILAYGQIGFELDGNRIKVGNGVSGWNNLNYIGGSGTGGGSTSGILNLNGLTSVTQTFALGTSGSDFNIISTGSAHTFYIPNATANSRGLLTSGDFLLLSGKLNNSLSLGHIFIGDGSNHPSGILVSGDGVINTTGSLILATVNSNIGSFTYATVTVDAKGRITAVSSGANPLLTAITSINGTTNAVQTLITGVDGTDFNIASITGVTAFNIPTSDATNRGLLSPTDWSTFNSKLSAAITSINSTTNAAQSLITGMVGSDFNIVSTTGVNSFNIPTANQNSRGLLSSGDWITFSGKLTSAITSINSTTNAAQSLITGVAGTDFNITSTTGVNIFSIPSAATGARGLLTSGDWITFAGKLSPTLASNDIFIGNGSNRASGVRIGGDATLGTTGALTLATVNATTGTYTFATITANAKGLVIAASSGNISSALDAISNITGVILYRSGNIWAALPPGSSGYALVSRGANLAPAYSLISGGGAGGISSLNSLTDASQTLSTGYTGNDFGISSAGGIHTFNLPTAATGTRGLLSSGDWISFAGKLSPTLASNDVFIGDGSNRASGVRIGGDATINTTGALILATVNSTTGTYVFATITANSKGLVIAASSGNISSALNAISNITGSILYSSGGTWMALPPGTSGRILTTAGINTLPSWVNNAGITGAILSLNGIVEGAQLLRTGMAGTDFTITSAGSGHTFNIPSASASNRGLLTSADWTTFNNKLSTSLPSGYLWIGDASNVASGIPSTGLFLGFDEIGGDATISETGNLTLATVNSNVGSFQFATVTVNAKGLTTAVTSGNISAGLDAISNITGTILYRSGTQWLGLPPGTSGRVLSTSGPNTYPVWASSAGGGITGAILTLNGLPEGAQLLIAGTGGSDFAISSVGSGHTFNIPTATANIRGVVSSGSFDIFDRSRVRQFGITIDGGGSVPSTGYKGSFRPNYSGQITKITMLAISPLDTTGYAVIDLYKDTFGNYRPTIADKITSTTPPTLSGVAAEQVVTGWTTAFSAGDVFGFDLIATGTLTKFNLIIDTLVV